jgi:high-affinity nickel-transport protein
METLVSGWLLGLVLGVRHAFEPDHLAAVSTFLVEEKSAKRSALLGALWGVGHSLALLVVGGALVMFRAHLPHAMAVAFEAAVAVLLLGLGARSLGQAARAWRVGPSTAHRHGRHAHAHGGPADHLHVGSWTFARRPLLVGIAHGLAGSGALTALALASMPTISAALVYLSVFCVGSVAAMALATGVVAWPLGRLTQNRRAQAALSTAAGLLSFTTGVLWLRALI